jgi:hypothetical protein
MFIQFGEHKIINMSQIASFQKFNYGSMWGVKFTTVQGHDLMWQASSLEDANVLFNVVLQKVDL